MRIPSPSPWPIRLRVVATFGFIAALLLGAMGRTLSLSVAHHDEYATRAAENARQRVPIPAERGRIFSADGKVLAQTVFSGSAVYINARQVRRDDISSLSQRLGDALNLDPAGLAAKIERNSRNAGLPLKFFVQPDELMAIRTLIDEGKAPGVHFRDRTERVYPRGVAGAQIVGFTNINGEGGSGIELAYDKFLRGADGWHELRVDARRRHIPNGEDLFQAPVDGADVHVTLDSTIQQFAEEAIRECVKDWDPEAITAIVMESKTGRILALANYPEFDPNRFFEAKPEAMKNRAITDAWEPGSIFKPLIYASALEDGLFTPDTPVPYKYAMTVKGRLILDDHPIRQNYHVNLSGDLDSGGAHVPLIVGMGKSSNPVAVNVAQSIFAGTRMTDLSYDASEVQPYEGAGRLDAALRRLGFGQFTGIDIGGTRNGESRGRIPEPSQWKDPKNGVRNVVPSVAMGYQVQVTALQMLNCFNAIACDGVRMRPYVVEKIVGRDGEELFTQGPEVSGHSGLSKETAASMRRMLEWAVLDGTGKGADLKDYRIAGKTGTAKISGKGGYVSDGRQCSFVGFGPVEDPRLTVMVTVRHPKKRKLNRYGYKLDYTGGNVAAPYMGDLMGKALRHLNVAPSTPIDIAEVRYHSKNNPARS